MKKIFGLIILISFTFFGCSKRIESSEGLNWLTNLEEAQKQAGNGNKTILVNFTGSDWCGWCIKLHDEVFSKDEFVQYANDNLVLIKIDFPRDKNLVTDEQKKYNEDLAKKYGIRGFPTILLLDKDLKTKGQTGYQDGGPVKYIEHIKSFI